MNVNEDRVRNAIVQEAADWYVANRAGLTAQERQSFAAWLKASPVHVEEYLALSVIGHDLRAACEAPQSSIDELLRRARQEEDTPVRPFPPRLIEGPRILFPRWQTAAVAMATIAVVSLGLIFLWTSRPGTQGPSATTVAAQHFETRHGEQQTYLLADHSILHLNTDTAVSVRYSAKERLVTLVSGEVNLEITHEPNRPFRLFAGSAEVVDLGTTFDVRLEGNSTLVTVAQGRVAVGPLQPPQSVPANPGSASRFVQLGPDEQITVSDGHWPATPVRVDARRTTAWIHRQMIFDSEPLERVASEFNRYAPKPIVITTPALRSLEISGVFAIDDSEAFIAFLRSLDGVHIQVTDTRILVSQQ
jgi:transmembrane sensor